MSKRSLFVLPGLFVILALILGAWTSIPGSFQVTPPPDGTQQPGSTPQPGGGPILTGPLASIPGLQAKINTLNAYKFRVNSVSTKSNRTDRAFLQSAYTSNALEIQMLQYSLDKVQNQNLHNLIQFMLDQHMQMQTVLQQANVRANRLQNTPDLTRVSVFPGTPSYDLGIRFVDLSAMYLDRLQGYTGSDFDRVALALLVQSHQDDVETGLAAQRSARAQTVRGLAKQSADVAALHLKLLQAVQDTEFLGIPSSISFEADQGGQPGGTGTPVVNPTIQSPTMQPSQAP